VWVLRFLSLIVLAITAALFHAAAAEATSWHLEEARTAWLLADGEHHAVWAAPGAREVTILDTRTRVRRVITLPGHCYAVINQQTTDARLAASGRALVTCNAPDPPSVRSAASVEVVLDLRTGRTTALPPVLGSGFWEEIGAHWAARRGDCDGGGSFCWSYVNLTSGVVVERPSRSELDLDQVELPRAAPCQRVALSEVFSTPLRSQARSFGSVVRPRQDGSRWEVERVSCTASRTLARERRFPQGVHVRGGLVSWTTATRPELALENGSGRGATVSVTRSMGGRPERWPAPRRTLHDCDGSRLGAYGRSFHTQERVFYAAALSFKRGRICTLGAQAIYSRPMPGRLRER